MPVADQEPANSSRDLGVADTPTDKDSGRLMELQATVQSLETVCNAVFRSASWRAGQRLAKWLRTLGVRLPVSTAAEDARRLIGELKRYAELPDLDQVPEPDSVALGEGFRLSRTVPRRYPVLPPHRPAHWRVRDDTRARIREEIQRWQAPPLVSVIIPAYNTNPEWLSDAIASIRNQLYPNWELCVIDDGSTDVRTCNALANLQGADDLCLVRRPKSGGIVEATNDGIARARGDYIAFVDHDDCLEPDALLQVARAINHTDADIVYTDEDKIDESGQRHYEPHYKPAFAPDQLLSQNYMSHLTVIKRALVNGVGGLRTGYEGSQDHDLLLRCVERANEVLHVPMILYHWRAVEGSTARRFSEKSYPWEAGRRAVAATLERRRIEGKVRLGDRPGTYRVERRIVGAPKVSILIPFRDKPELLEQCIASVLRNTGYPHFEIIGIDNQSQEATTRKLTHKLARADERVRFERFDRPFNFSAINNFGAERASGDHLLLLNNDTEVISDGWLAAMLAHSQREEVGAVGAKLLYPDRRIQHAGAVLGIGGVAGHSHKLTANDDNGYFSRPHITHNVSAVTGACVMIARDLFLKIGGLDEDNLSIAFNDIDLCMRLREAEYLNVYEPGAVLYHHESLSRGYEDAPDKIERFAHETQYMRKRHGRALTEPDPYYSPNLSRHSESFLPR